MHHYCKNCFENKQYEFVFQFLMMLSIAKARRNSCYKLIILHFLNLFPKFPYSSFIIFLVRRSFFIVLIVFLIFFHVVFIASKPMCSTATSLV